MRKPGRELVGVNLWNDFANQEKKKGNNHNLHYEPKYRRLAEIDYRIYDIGRKNNNCNIDKIVGYQNSGQQLLGFFK